MNYQNNGRLFLFQIDCMVTVQDFDGEEGLFANEFIVIVDTGTGA
jgi:hypothetical protein